MQRKTLFQKLSELYEGQLPLEEKVRIAREAIEADEDPLAGKMLEEGPKIDPARLQWFSREYEIDLSVAHTNQEIWARGGKGIFVRYASRGISGYTSIRFNSIEEPTYPIMPGYIKGAFNKIYLTNTAQAGKTFCFFISFRELAHYGMLDISLYNLRDDICGSTNKSLFDLWNQAKEISKHAEDLIQYTVTMTNADEEYDQVLPDYTTQLTIRCRDGTAMRYAFVIDKVATPTEPYHTILANIERHMEGLSIVGKTLYVACGSAGKVAEIEIGKQVA